MQPKAAIDKAFATPLRKDNVMNAADTPRTLISFRIAATIADILSACDTVELLDRAFKEYLAPLGNLTQAITSNHDEENDEAFSAENIDWLFMLYEARRQFLVKRGR